MGGPGWLSDIFAALMLTVAVYCAGRLVTARWWRRPTELDTDGAHIVMGVAMAGMLVSGLRTLPADLWEGVFAAGAAWFGWHTLRARRGSSPGPWRCLHAAPHLVECAAMLYMFLLLPASAAVRSTTAGMGAISASPAASRFSFLALAMALFLLGYVVWLADRLTVHAPALALPAGAAASGLETGEPVPGGSTSSGGCADAGSGLGRPHLAPRCAVVCKIAMGTTMGYMLILML
jgi:hypothetical protein